MRSRIRGDEVQTGDALPSERQLVEDFGVSRITVVKALDILDQEGLIERQHGYDRGRPSNFLYGLAKGLLWA